MKSSRMLERCVVVVSLLCVAAAPSGWAVPQAQAGAQSFELRGRIYTPEGKLLQGRMASVSLFGATTPFVADVLALGGQFKFGKLPAGTYMIAVFVPGLGETRQTVEVGKSLADSKGRVEVKIVLRESTTHRRRTSTVSVRELGIPEPARAEYQRALKALSGRQVEAAIGHLEKAVELSPNYVEAINHLGTIHYQTRQYARAEEYFRQALAQDGNAYEPLVNLGGTLLSLNRYEEALAINRHATLARPEDALAHSQLGLNLFALGDLENAVTHLNRAKKLDPAHFSHPQMTLAEIYLRKGDREAAIAELEEFVRLHPDDPNAPKFREGISRLRQKP